MATFRVGRCVDKTLLLKYFGNMICRCSFSNCWKLGIGNSDLLVIFVWLTLKNSGISARICTDLYRFAHKLFKNFKQEACFFRRAHFISVSKIGIRIIQFSNNPGISVRICTDLYGFAGVLNMECH